MDYESMSAKEFRELGVDRRESIYAKTMYVGSIRATQILEDAYVELCGDGAGGDPIAQDLLAEWFRNGNQVVPENIDISMRWLILAGANGNKYSLDRLKIHFGFAFDAIIALNDFPNFAVKHGINGDNYQYILGKLLCDAVVDDMKIDAYDLARRERVAIPYSAVILRAFDRSITRAIDIVVEYLRR